MKHWIVEEIWIWNVREQEYVGVILHHKFCPACALGVPL